MGPTELDPELAEKYRGAPGTGSRMRWFFSGVWLVYLVGPLWSLAAGHQSVLKTVGGFVLVAAYSSVYLAGIVGKWRSPHLHEPSKTFVFLALLGALALTGSLVYGPDWTGMWIYVACGVGMLVAGKTRATLGILAVTLVFCLVSWIVHTAIGEFLGLLLPTAVTGFAMVAFRRQILLVRELARARQTVARLAANEERLRLARDLHDLTGHSLSLITLKAELTQRILARLPESPAREALGKELADIEHVSRQTLHDIREAVSGYRRPTLAVEIITARTALEAAGITLAEDSSIIMRSGTFDPQAEAALAWCLREATTNLIRHAGARNCWISLRELDSELALRVVDDGQGPVTTRRDEPAQHGNGLHGMSERLNSVGGRLSTGRAGVGGGFRLVAVVPYRPIEACPHEDGSPASTSPEEREVSRRATEEARGELDRRAPSARPARANVPL